RGDDDLLDLVGGARVLGHVEGAGRGAGRVHVGGDGGRGDAGGQRHPLGRGDGPRRGHLPHGVGGGDVEGGAHDGEVVGAGDAGAERGGGTRGDHRLADGARAVAHRVDVGAVGGDGLDGP